MTSSPGKYIKGELVFIIVIIMTVLLDKSIVIASWTKIFFRFRLSAFIAVYQQNCTVFATDTRAASKREKIKTPYTNKIFN